MICNKTGTFIKKGYYNLRKNESRGIPHNSTNYLKCPISGSCLEENSIYENFTC